MRGVEMMIAERRITTFATAKQRSKIAQLCIALGLQERLEDTVITSREASDLIKELCACLKVNKEEGRLSIMRRSVHDYGSRQQTPC